MYILEEALYEHIDEKVRNGKIDDELILFLREYLQKFDSLPEVYELFSIVAAYHIEAAFTDCLKNNDDELLWQEKLFYYFILIKDDNQLKNVLAKMKEIPLDEKELKIYLAKAAITWKNYFLVLEIFNEGEVHSEDEQMLLGVAHYRLGNKEQAKHYFESVMEQTSVSIDDPLFTFVRTNQVHRSEQLFEQFYQSLEIEFPIYVPNPIKIKKETEFTKSTIEKFDVTELNIELTHYFRTYSFYKAVLFAENLVYKQPRWYISWKIFGNALEKLGHLEYAREAYYQGAILTNKEKNWYGFGRFCEKYNFPIDACCAYLKVIKMNEENWNAIEQLRKSFHSASLNFAIYEGNNLFHMTEEKLINEMIDTLQDNVNSSAYRTLASIYKYKEELDVAADYMLKEICAYVPVETRVIRLGIWALQHELFEHAHGIFSKALEYYPDNSIAKWGVETLQDPEKMSRINEDITKFLQIYPHLPSLEDIISFEKECIANGDRQQGLYVFNQLTKIYPDDLGANVSYVKMLELNGNVEEAYERSKISVAMKPSIRNIYMHLIFCFQYDMLHRAETFRKSHVNTFLESEEFLALINSDEQQEVISQWEKTQLIYDVIANLKSKISESENILLNDLLSLLRHSGKQVKLTELLDNYFSHFFYPDDMKLLFLELPNERLTFALNSFMLDRMAAKQFHPDGIIEQFVSELNQNVYNVMVNIYEFLQEERITFDEFIKIKEITLTVGDIREVLKEAVKEGRYNYLSTLAKSLSLVKPRNWLAYIFYNIFVNELTGEELLKKLPLCIEINNVPFYHLKIAQHYFMNGQWQHALTHYEILENEFPDTKETKSAVKFKYISMIIVSLKSGNIEKSQFNEAIFVKTIRHMLKNAEFIDYVKGLENRIPNDKKTSLLIKGMRYQVNYEADAAYNYYQQLKPIHFDLYKYCVISLLNDLKVYASQGGTIEHHLNLEELELVSEPEERTSFNEDFDDENDEISLQCDDETCSHNDLEEYRA